MFYLDKPKSSKETTILLKTYLPGGIRFTYSTGESILPEHWSKDANRPKNIRGEIGNKLKYISAKLVQIEKIYENIQQHATLNNILLDKEYLRWKMDLALKNSVKQKTKDDIPSLIKNHISTRANDISFGKSTKSRYSVLYELILEFDSIRGKRTFAVDINKEWYYNFLNFLFDDKKYLDNTVGSYISKLKCVIGWAKKSKIITSEVAEDAISNLTVLHRDSDKVFLTFDELEKLETLDLSENKKLEKVRDLFLIGCYSGQRFSDYTLFDKSEYRNGMIHKIAEKTELTSYIPVDSNPPLKTLLDKYDWKLPKISNQKFNEYIKEIACKACIDTPVKQTSFRGREKIETITPKYKLIGSHTARRTFISLALKNHMDPKTIMNIAGIKNVDTLFTYDKVNADAINEQIERFVSKKTALKGRP